MAKVRNKQTTCFSTLHVFSCSSCFYFGSGSRGCTASWFVIHAALFQRRKVGSLRSAEMHAQCSLTGLWVICQRPLHPHLTTHHRHFLLVREPCLGLRLTFCLDLLNVCHSMMGPQINNGHGRELWDTGRKGRGGHL